MVIEVARARIKKIDVAMYTKGDWRNFAFKSFVTAKKSTPPPTAPSTKSFGTFTGSVTAFIATANVIVAAPTAR